MEEAGRRQAAERQAAQEAEQQSSIGGLGGVEVQIPNVPDTTPTVDLIGSLRNTLNRAIIAARREQRAPCQKPTALDSMSEVGRSMKITRS